MKMLFRLCENIADKSKNGKDKNKKTIDFLPRILYNNSVTESEVTYVKNG